MVREVAFHFNAPDKTGYACRLLRKAYLKGARLMVRVPHQQLAILDAGLWTLSPGEFLPHSVPGDPAPLVAHSPIRLSDQAEAPANFNVLVNLCDEMPADADQFERIIEVVTLDEEDRAQARQRWRRYKAMGLEPVRYDLKLSA